MKKQRFFVIKGGKYGSALFYFQNLDSAMKMFQFLVEGNAVNIETESMPPIKEPKGDGDEYVPDDHFHHITGEPEYHLYSEIKEIYIKEEIEKIKKKRKQK